MRFLKLLLPTASVAFLVACGGGSDSGPAATPTATSFTGSGDVLTATPPQTGVEAVPSNVPLTPSAANTSDGMSAGFRDQDFRAAIDVSVGGGNTLIGIDPNAQGGNGAIVAVGGDVANMAWCRPSSYPSFLVAQYWVGVPNGRVAHRVGVQDWATGQFLYDTWQYTDVLGGAFSWVRYLNAPPAGRYWAPFIQVYRAVNNQWQFYFSYYLKVNYSYDWCG